MGDEIKLQKITYYRPIKPPTLKQFMIRKAIGEAGHQAKDITGVSPDGNRFLPNSAIAIREKVKGQTAEQIAAQHPEWVREYNDKHGRTKS